MRSTLGKLFQDKKPGGCEEEVVLEEREPRKPIEGFSIT